MDPGLLALKNAISLADNHEDDFENDEELLAELLELQGADNHHNRKPIPSLSGSENKNFFNITVICTFRVKTENSGSTSKTYSKISR
jgi:hypothetical protein